jgi:nitrate/nitrite transporter NarK
MGKELAFAMGATLCVSRLGSSLNSFLSPKINDWSGYLWLPFAIGVGLCILSWIGVMTLAAMDKKADQEEGIANQAPTEETEKFKLSDFKKFNLMFYLLLFNCFFIYGAFFGLNNNLNKIMTDRFGFLETTAGNFIPIVYICSAVITPFFGLFTDRYGKRIVYMLVASLIFIIDHLIIAFLPDGTTDSPQYGMVGALLGVGLFYSTYAAVFWPCVPLVVDANVVGTAYGIITSLQNCMLAVIPLIIDKIHADTIDFHFGYFWTEIFLAGITFIGFCITSWIFIEDFRGNKKLHKPTAKNPERSNSGSFLK